MARIIAGVYEIQKKIGSGGGGIVYLGEHLRLKKQVALKADKRRLSVDPEKLRREVDMLKNLTHTYIPQVYDFVQEDGIVYTVMDYIEGESLDKVLVRREAIPQPEILKWACQLLEALIYLHSRPPHGILHADIKPANIMLRPDGNICLIDYNIALALGEDGAVKVGLSRGYASPEHYGADYIKENRAGASPFSLHSGSEKHGAATEAEDVPKKYGTVTEAEDAPEKHGAATEVEDAPEKYGTVTEAEDAPEKYETVTEAEDGLEETLPDEKAVLSGIGKQMPARIFAGKSGMAGNTTGKSSTGRSGGVLLDVRSDIYSLGATLYHLLSGYRPPQEAEKVVPLGADVCSIEVSKIIRKAMSPDPAQRYQSAEEMRNAFLLLPKRDIRTIRHKRRIACCAAALGTAFLAGGFCTFIGLKQLEQRQSALALAEYSGNALAEGDVSGAVSLALQAIPDGKSILNAAVTPQAQKALSDALGVYDLTDGFKAVDTVKLPSAPFDIAISPEGTRFAVVYAYEAAIYETETLQEIVSLPVQESALSDAVFTDEGHILYAGKEGVAGYDLIRQEIMWTGNTATTLAVSGDGKRVAAVNRDEERAYIYDAADGKLLAECFFEGHHMPVTYNDTFADAGNSIFALNEDGSLLAVSFSDGGLYLFHVGDTDGDLEIYGASEYVHFEGGFHGGYFVFAADSSSHSLFGLVDTESAEYLGGAESQDNFLLQAGKEGVYLASGNLLVAFDPETMQQLELAYTGDANITDFAVKDGYVLAATDDSGFSFFDSAARKISSELCEKACDFVRLSGGNAVIGNRNEPSVRILKLEGHDESRLMSYDARYAHDEARIAQDGKTAMFFDYQGFRIYDMDGNLVTEMKLPEPERIYDQQFRREGDESWLEVIWYDGTVRCYSATDGSLLSEEMSEAPSKELEEEFYTDQYKIVSKLHDAPEAYDITSGKRVGTLEKDSYLAYVTQTGEYIITEYINTEGTRYGLLLDNDLQTLAYLPGLCDIWEGMLVFDDGAGSLRQSRIYSLEELCGMGESYGNEIKGR